MAGMWEQRAVLFVGDYYSKPSNPRPRWIPELVPGLTRVDLNDGLELISAAGWEVVSVTVRHIRGIHGARNIPEYTLFLRRARAGSALPGLAASDRDG